MTRNASHAAPPPRPRFAPAPRPKLPPLPLSPHPEQPIVSTLSAADRAVPHAPPPPQPPHPPQPLNPHMSSSIPIPPRADAGSRHRSQVAPQRAGLPPTQPTAPMHVAAPQQRAQMHQPPSVMAASLPAAHTLGGIGPTGIGQRSAFAPQQQMQMPMQAPTAPVAIKSDSMPPVPVPARGPPRGATGSGAGSTSTSELDPGLAVAAAANAKAANCVMEAAIGHAAAAEQAEAESWPPRPKLELMSRSARRWITSGDRGTHRSSRGRPAFDADFSEVASAVDSVRDALQTGKAGVERPPRESVSGTYFFRRVESGQFVDQPSSVGGNGSGDRFDAMFGHPGAAEDCFADARAAAVPTATTYSGGFAGGQGAFCPERSRDALTSSPALGSQPCWSSGDPFSLASRAKSKSKKVTAVFKPADEEPVESSPSESLVSSPMLSLPRMSPDFHDGGSRAARMAAAGFRAGEGAYKEVAAYILDKGFAGVPQTALACYTHAGADGDSVALTNADGSIISNEKARELKGGEAREDGDGEKKVHLITKVGAVQVYCENVGDADDWGPGLFPTDSVHRIAVLDIRTMNYDRHGGNILVTKGDDGSYDLVPIDHAFTLPETVQAVPWAIWMDWPAAKKPMSQETLDYIDALEPELDARHLQDELEGAVRLRSIRSLKIATRLLQRGAAAGMSLYEIGKLIYVREGESPTCKSVLEKIGDEAVEASERRTGHMGAFFSEPDDTVAADGIFRLDSPKPPRSPPPPSARKKHTEDYICRYASRSIDDHIRRIVDSKGSGGGCALGRARSMHDFGFNLGKSAAAIEANAKFNEEYDPVVEAEPFLMNAAGSPPYMPQTISTSHVSPPPASLINAASEGMATVLGRTSSIGVSFAVAQAASGEPPSKLMRGKSSPVSPHDFEWHTDLSSP